MEPGFPASMPKWVLRLLSLAAPAAARSIVTGILLLFLFGICALFADRLAGDEPVLQRAAVLGKLFLIIAAHLVVAVIAGFCLFHLVRPDHDNGPSDGQ